MTIVQACLMLQLIIKSIALYCALYDHSEPTVKCVSSCPSGTVNVDSHCLGPYMYMLTGQVKTCQGYVSSDRSLCCPAQHFISNNQCLPCRGTIFNNGLSCCQDDHYLDYSAGQTNCVPLSTGSCNQLKISSLFKYCCP